MAMELVLMRHATAEAGSSSGKDRDRALTPEGIVEAKTAGVFLKRLAWEPDFVLASPYLRTVETAANVEIGLGQELNTEQEDFLASGMRVADATSALRRFKNKERVLLIGHQPDFGMLIAHLTGCSVDAVHVPKASLWALRIEGRVAAGSARLLYFAPPSLIRKVVL